MAERGGLLKRVLDLPNDDPRKTLFVAVSVALICAITVSLTAVLLRPVQVANLQREREAQLALIIAQLPGMEEILRSAGADSLVTRTVSLTDGGFAPDIDAATFDQRAAAGDPELSIELAPDSDIAGIKRRSNFAPVFFLEKDGRPFLTVLPFHGAGYQSTFYGYLALQEDLNTVAALTIYETGDTPGLGARIAEAEWQALWPGKQVADETGAIRIEAIRDAAGPHQVDAISGATRTTDGVTNALRFWLGDDGFGPFLDNLRSGDV